MPGRWAWKKAKREEKRVPKANKPKRVQTCCLGCRAVTYNLDKHRLTATCHAKTRFWQLVREGWAPCGHDAPLLRRLGIEVRKEPTSVNPRTRPFGLTGTELLEASLLPACWAPSWAARIAGEHDIPLPTRKMLLCWYLEGYEDRALEHFAVAQAYAKAHPLPKRPPRRGPWKGVR